jgi:hypothetical protein
MKHSLIVIALTLAAACTAQESTPPAASSTSGGAADAAADVPEVLSQDEADAAAAKEINKDNADAELEQLKNEIGGEK